MNEPWCGECGEPPHKCGCESNWRSRALKAEAARDDNFAAGCNIAKSREEYITAFVAERQAIRDNLIKTCNVLERSLDILCGLSHHQANCGVHQQNSMGCTCSFGPSYATAYDCISAIRKLWE